MFSQLIISMPSGNLEQTKQFYNALGFQLEPRYCRAGLNLFFRINEGAAVMFFERELFKTAVSNSKAEIHPTRGAIANNSVEAVDAAMDHLLTMGGMEFASKHDDQYMYARHLQDLDGNQWQLYFWR